jgi:hypothetical protein
VFEMFCGEPPCRHGGHLASEVLEGYLESGAQPEGLPRIPEKLIQVVRQCIRRAPAERWGTMAEAADVLMRIFEEQVGRAYERPAPSLPNRDRFAGAEQDRRSTVGVSRDDPCIWLRQALRAAAHDPAEAEADPPADDRVATHDLAAEAGLNCGRGGVAGIAEPASSV